MAKRTTTKSVSKASAVEAPVSSRGKLKFRLPNLPWEKSVPAIYMGLLLGAFALGSLWQQVAFLRSGGVVNPGTQVTQQAAVPTDVPVSVDQIKALFTAGSISFGDANRKVLFVEVGDPSCPYCSIAAGHNPALNKEAGANFTLAADGGTYLPPVQEMKKLVDTGQASFVYLYTPGHGNGEMATKAFYCAQEKGKFWPVHDLIMTADGYDLVNNTIKNDKTKSGELAEFLKSVIPAADLKACLDSGKYDSRLTSDVALAQSLGVTGTPGFFVNGTKYAGAYSFADMKATVDAALK